MHESLLSGWEAFYLIVGTAAGALTGLQFVVITLISETGQAQARKDSVSAFGSPTVVHFCAALLLSAILTAPWDTIGHAGAAISGCGVLGLIYAAVVLRRTVRQGGYRPVAEDWIWHVILPAISYGVLLVAGSTLERVTYGSLFFIGGASLMLVFIGIHNAWDTVMYIAVEGRANFAGRDRPSGDAVPLGQDVRGETQPARALDREDS